MKIWVKFIRVFFPGLTYYEKKGEKLEIHAKNRRNQGD